MPNVFPPTYGAILISNGFSAPPTITQSTVITADAVGGDWNGMGARTLLTDGACSSRTAMEGL